jgi:hypothetical protein
MRKIRFGQVEPRDREGKKALFPVFLGAGGFEA